MTFNVTLTCVISPTHGSQSSVLNIISVPLFSAVFWFGPITPDPGSGPQYVEEQTEAADSAKPHILTFNAYHID